MKIALVNKAVSLSHGGLERFSANLARSLQAAGHEVHVFAERADDLPEEIRVHPVRSARKPSFARLVTFAADVRRQLSGQRFDIVYGLTHMLNPDVYRMGDGVQRHWMRVRYPFAPWRWLNYLVNPAHAVHLWLERRIYAGSSLIITNSALCRNQVQEYYGVSPDRVRIVYNGVDHRLFNPETVRAGRNRLRTELGLGEEDILLLHVSNNWKRKGLGTTLQAMSRLGERTSACHLLVVGRGRAEPFRLLAKRLGLAGKVHFRPATNQIGDCYGAADLLVLPTLYDPFSNVCLEAMACARAVVTTRGNGASELITPGRNGFVQEDPRNAEELSGLLAQVLDRRRLESMGLAARESARDFTLERNLQETLEVFRRIGARQDRGAK